MKRFSTSAILVALIAGSAYFLYAPVAAVEGPPNAETSPVNSTRVAPPGNHVDLSSIASSANAAPPTIVRSSEASTLSMSWWAAGGGGVLGKTGIYPFGGMVNQGAVGSGTVDGVRLGTGFWHGARVCLCPNQGDGNDDHVLNAVDLNLMIDALFFGGPNPRDPSCPNLRFDVDCSKAPDAVDLNYLIDHLFFGGPVPCQPCP